MSNPYKIRGIPLSSKASDMVDTPSSNNTSLFNSSSGIGIPSGDVKYKGSWFRQTLGETYTQGSTTVFNNGTAKCDKYTAGTTISLDQFPTNVWGIRVVAIGGGGGGGGGGGSANYAYTGGGGGGGGNGSVLFSPYIPFRGEAGSNLISKIDITIGSAGAGGGTEGRNNGYNGSNGGSTGVVLTSINGTQLLSINVPGGEGGFGGQVGNNVNTETTRTRGSGFGGYSGDSPTISGILYNTYSDTMEVINCTSTGVGQTYQNTIAKNDGYVNQSTGNRGTNGNGFTVSINGADGESRISAPTSKYPDGGGGGTIRYWTPSGYAQDYWLPPWGVAGSPGNTSSDPFYGANDGPWATIPLQSGNDGNGGSGGRGGNHDGNKKPGGSGVKGAVWILWYYTPPPTLPYNTTSDVTYNSTSNQYFTSIAMPWFVPDYSALTTDEQNELSADMENLSRYFNSDFTENQLVAIGYDELSSTEDDVVVPSILVVRYDPTDSTAVNGVVPPYYMSINTSGKFLYIQTSPPESGSFTFKNADLGSNQYVFQFPYYDSNGYTINIELVGGGGSGGGGGSSTAEVAGGGGSGGNSGYITTGRLSNINAGDTFYMDLGDGGGITERTFTSAAGISTGYGQGANADNIENPPIVNGYQTQPYDWDAQIGQDGGSSSLQITWTDSNGNTNNTNFTAYGGEGGLGAGKVVLQLTTIDGQTYNNVTIQQIGANSKSKNTSYGQTNYQGGAGGGGGSNFVADSGENSAQTIIVVWNDTNKANPPIVTPGAISYPQCHAIVDWTSSGSQTTISANGTSTDATDGSEGYGVFITYAPNDDVVNNGYDSNYRLEPSTEGGGGGNGEGSDGSDGGGQGGGGGPNWITYLSESIPERYEVEMGGGGGGGGGSDNGGYGGTGGTLGPLEDPNSPVGSNNKYTSAPGGDGILGGGGGGGHGAGLTSYVDSNGANGGAGGGGYLKITFTKNT